MLLLDLLLPSPDCSLPSAHRFYINCISICLALWTCVRFPFPCWVTVAVRLAHTHILPLCSPWVKQKQQQKKEASDPLIHPQIFLKFSLKQTPAISKHFLHIQKCLHKYCFNYIEMLWQHQIKIDLIFPRPGNWVMAHLVSLFPLQFAGKGDRRAWRGCLLIVRCVYSLLVDR